MINVGLIGYGKYGKKYYKNLISNRNFKIIKVLRKSKRKINHIFTNSPKKFFKLSNIDLYIIASPTETHYEYLKNVLDKKKHIIVGNEFNSMVSYDGKKYHGITNLNLCLWKLQGY